jgi:hypothetical protein
LKSKKKEDIISKEKIKKVCTSSFSAIFLDISLVILGLIIKHEGKRKKAPIYSTSFYVFSRLSR